MLRAASDHLEALERVDGLSGTRVNTPWRNLQCRRRPPACAPLGRAGVALRKQAALA